MASKQHHTASKRHRAGCVERPLAAVIWEDGDIDMMNKDDRIYANHPYRRSIASIVGIMVGGILIALAVGGWLAQGFNPLAVGYGVLVVIVSIAMK
jgi:hypothetical protein